MESSNWVLFFSESKTYKINVVTKSREELTFIRLSPKAVQRAVEETFKNNINVSKNIAYHHKKERKYSTSRYLSDSLKVGIRH